MEKVYSNRYPTLEQEQFDLNRALISMLNCRRYIHSQGFQEVTGDNNNINGIAGGYAKIVFPDGSTVSSDNFQKTLNRDSLLESMISKGVILKPNSSRYDNYERPRVVTNTFKRNGYSVHLVIKDTTKKKRGFLLGIGHNAEMFSFVYDLYLSQDVIKDADLEEFAKYQQCLYDAMKQETLLTYSAQVPQRKSVRTKEVELPQVETHFINPWDVEIPKIGRKEK